MHAKLAKIRPLGKVPPHQLGGHRRHQHLAAMADSPQPGAPVHHRPIEVSLALLHLPGMYRHPHCQRGGEWPGLGGKNSLQLQGGGDRLGWAGEDAEGAVALPFGLDQAPP